MYYQDPYLEMYIDNSETSSNEDNTTTTTEESGIEFYQVNNIQNESESEEDNDDESQNDYLLDEDELDEMYEIDKDYLRQEKQNNKYYLGLVILTTFTPQNWQLQISVSPNLFYRYPYKKIQQYLVEYCYSFIVSPQVDIVQLKIQNIDGWEHYFTIIKTYWIRLIQRHWRKVYQENQRRIEKKKSPIIQRYREIHGKYPTGLKSYGIQGLMAQYSKPIKQINNP